jgi:hypothetical protein
MDNEYIIEQTAEIFRNNRPDFADKSIEVKWCDLMFDFDEYFREKYINYNSEKFIRDCYGLV